MALRVLAALALLATVHSFESAVLEFEDAASNRCKLTFKDKQLSTDCGLAQDFGGLATKVELDALSAKFDDLALSLDTMDKKYISEMADISARVDALETADPTPPPAPKCTPTWVVGEYSACKGASLRCGSHTCRGGNLIAYYRGRQGHNERDVLCKCAEDDSLAADAGMNCDHIKFIKPESRKPCGPGPGGVCSYSANSCERD